MKANLNVVKKSDKRLPRQNLSVSMIYFIYFVLFHYKFGLISNDNFTCVNTHQNLT